MDSSYDTPSTGHMAGWVAVTHPLAHFPFPVDEVVKLNHTVRVDGGRTLQPRGGANVVALLQVGTGADGAAAAQDLWRVHVTTDVRAVGLLHGCERAT